MAPNESKQAFEVARLACLHRARRRRPRLTGSVGFGIETLLTGEVVLQVLAGAVLQVAAETSLQQSVNWWQRRKKRAAAAQQILAQVNRLDTDQRTHLRRACVSHAFAIATAASLTAVVLTLQLHQLLNYLAGSDFSGLMVSTAAGALVSAMCLLALATGQIRSGLRPNWKPLIAGAMIGAAAGASLSPSGVSGHLTLIYLSPTAIVFLVLAGASTGMFAIVVAPPPSWCWYPC